MKIKFTGIEDAEFQAKIRLYHQEFVERVQTWLLKPTFRKTIIVHVCDRMKSNGGWAYGAREMKLNYWMLYRNDKELRETYGHELAHLITCKLYRRKVWKSKRGFTIYSPSAHGHEWKHVMKSLGLPPERCHKFTRDVMTSMKKEYREYKHGPKNKTQQEDVLPSPAPAGRTGDNT